MIDQLGGLTERQTIQLFTNNVTTLQVGIDVQAVGDGVDGTALAVGHSAASVAVSIAPILAAVAAIAVTATGGAVIAIVPAARLRCGHVGSLPFKCVLGLGVQIADLLLKFFWLGQQAPGPIPR